MAQLVKHSTLDLGVVSSSPVLGVDYLKSFKKIKTTEQNSHKVINSIHSQVYTMVQAGSMLSI